MDAKGLNDRILENRLVSDVLKDIIKNEPDTPDFYNLCREMYENIYNSIVKIEGNFQSYLSDDIIDNLISNIEIFINKNGLAMNNEIFAEIIDVIRRFNIDTATEKELESRVHVDTTNSTNGNFGKFGTLYDFNTYPDWDGLKKDMIKRFNN